VVSGAFLNAVDQPATPIAAVTHADPYPYYAALVAQRPLYRDDALGLWVASSAAAVRAVMTSELCRVRPADEPVPKALVGSPAGAIFGHLVRMNDGGAHLRAKLGVSGQLASLDSANIAQHGAACARRLAEELEPARDGARLANFVLRLPTYVIASVLGFPAEQLSRLADWTLDFVGCLAPAATPERLEAGKAAAARLAEAFVTHTGRTGVDSLVANRIGYLSQACEATAGLIGNTLLALGRHHEAAGRVATDRAFLAAVIREVVRHDAPVQNTRRFVAESGTIAGEAMREGDAVLVVLAAANRDPAANPDGERFEPLRKERQAFTFSLGAHACPGETLATLITVAGVDQLLGSGVQPERLARRVSYRPSANLRIPLFAS
jgi:cytochrome P450